MLGVFFVFLSICFERLIETCVAPDLLVVYAGIAFQFVHDNEQALPSNIMFVCILSDTQQSLRPACLFVCLSVWLFVLQLSTP